MKELEIYPRGSSRTRIREQMDRLFNASISLVYENESNKTSINTQIAARTEFWWNERKPDERTLWQSKVVLSHEFFHEIVFHPAEENCRLREDAKKPLVLAKLKPMSEHRRLSSIRFGELGAGVGVECEIPAGGG